MSDSEPGLFYVLWVNRNGVHLWSGPYQSRTMAEGQRAMTIDGAGALILERRFLTALTESWEERAAVCASLTMAETLRDCASEVRDAVRQVAGG